MPNLLKEFIEEVIAEAGFSFGKFQHLASSNKRVRPDPEPDEWNPGKFLKPTLEQDEDAPELQYARSFLPLLGEGSSRIAFILPNKNVLKIALNAAGFGQNESEVEVWSTSRSPYITQVFDYAVDYKWVICEIVKEISRNEAVSWLGVSEGQLQNITGKFVWDEFKTTDDVKQYYSEAIKRTNKYIDDLNAKLADYIAQGKEKNDYKGATKSSILSSIESEKKDIKTYTTILNNQNLMNFLDGMVYLATKHNLMWADVRLDHIGRNPSGQLKLLDFGYTSDVKEKFYE